MELSVRLHRDHVPERLRYARALLELMRGADHLAQRALVGGVVMWLGAVDQTLEELNPEIAGVGYRARRSQDVGGMSLLGLRLARNEIAHGTALVAHEAIAIPMVIPAEFLLYFIPAHELANHYRDRREADLKEHHLSLYRTYVAGEEPEDVLRSALEWLEGIVSQA